MASLDSFGAKSQLQVGEESFEIFGLDALGELNLPYTHRVLLENLLRTEDGANVTAEQIRALAAWDATAAPSQEIQFTPDESVRVHPIVCPDTTRDRLQRHLLLFFTGTQRAAGRSGAAHRTGEKRLLETATTRTRGARPRTILASHTRPL